MFAIAIFNRIRLTLTEICEALVEFGFLLCELLLAVGDVAPDFELAGSDGPAEVEIVDYH